MHFLSRFFRELAAASACGLASALLWLTLGNLWTWAVDYEHVHGVIFLGNAASAAIVVPAFAFGWILFLVRRTVLASRGRFVLASLALTFAGALVHRAAFFDDATWATAHSFIDAADVVLAVVVRVATDVDVRFMFAPPLASWSMVVGALVAAIVLSVVAYRPAHALTHPPPR